MLVSAFPVLLLDKRASIIDENANYKSCHGISADRTVLRDAMTENNKPYVFISYSTKNQGYAEAVRALLAEEKMDNWMAPYDIPSGQDYTDVVSNAIQNAACLVLLLTEDAQNSVYVDKEIERALHYGKTIAPIQLGSLTLNDSFSFYLCNQQIEMLPTIDDSTPKMQNLLHHLQYLCNDRLPPKEETLDATRDKRVRRQKTARLFRWLGFILLCVSLFCGHQYVTMISWVSYTELYGTSFIPTLSKVAGSYCLFFFLAVVAVLSWLYGSGLKDIQKNTWSFFGVLPLPQLR